MLSIPDEIQIFLWSSATDMRCGFDRLVSMVREKMNHQVLSGGIFVFLSRTRDRVKLLWWDKDGYALFYKRLEAGTFKVDWSESGHEVLTGVDLRLLLSGMDLRRIKLRRNAEKGLFSELACGTNNG